MGYNHPRREVIMGGVQTPSVCLTSLYFSYLSFDCSQNRLYHECKETEVEKKEGREGRRKDRPSWCPLPGKPLFICGGAPFSFDACALENLYVCVC